MGGLLHHAIPGTGAVAVAAAAAIPGTVVSQIASAASDGRLRVGHPSGIVEVGADVSRIENRWTLSKAQFESISPTPDGRPGLCPRPGLVSVSGNQQDECLRQKRS